MWVLRRDLTRVDGLDGLVKLSSDTSSDFTSSVSLLEKKLSKITGNVSIGELAI